MKTLTRSLAAVLAALFLSASACAAEAFPTTGADWQKLPREEKFKIVFASIIAFDDAGVPFQRSPNHYILLIDLLLKAYPELRKEDAANLLAAVVYKFEPESRVPLILAREKWETEKLERDLLKRYTGIPVTE